MTQLPLAVALDAGLILLREGLEAVLVLAALGALLRRAAPEQGRKLAWGAAGGIAASLVAALAFHLLLGGEHDDRIEAATCLLAAGLMLWTGGWLARRADPRAWSLALRRQADRALAGRRVGLAVAAIGFLAVFREGAETVLFLGTLGSGGQPMALGAGLAVAAALLGLLWRVISRGTVRLPLRPLFLGTSVFLLVMAARFTAAAVQELQEQLLLPFSPVDLPDPLGAAGLPDSLEGLAAAAAVLLLGLTAFRGSRTPAGGELAEAPQVTRS
ncbi:FTR1 family protein [Falsiroseomonas sp. CW058]|uniref:FTR1 family protein n=1 Tax=Falsiroseomonas sp. CW058 TaxID=3388664 RepID=UPI003D3186CA